MPQLLEITWRTIIAVIVLFILTKILGKRQIAQLSFFEYITGISIGSIAAAISLDTNISWFLGVVALIVWTGVSFGLEYITLKSKFARDIIDGKSSIIIKDGKVLEDNLTKAHLTTDELLAQLRGKNAFKLADVEYAVLETNGKLNVLLNKENQPLTSKLLGLKLTPEPEPQAVIMDGKIIDEPLATLGLNRGWLKTELEKIGVTVENVFLGQVDAYGELTVDLFDDLLQVPQQQGKAQLLATLKKCEADMEMFALSSKEKGAKELYSTCSKQLLQVIASVRPILTR